MEKKTNKVLEFILQCFTVGLNLRVERTLKTHQR